MRAARGTILASPCEERILDDSLLGLDPSRDDDAVPAPWPPPGGLQREHDPFARPEPVEVEVHLDRIVGAAPPPKDDVAEDRPLWGIDRERAVALSVILHLLIALAVILAPPPKKLPEVPPDQLPDPLGIVKLMTVPPPEPPIPVDLFPSPGPRAPAPGPRPRPSDLDRQAHGGDPKLPKAVQPRSVAKSGIQDLEEGKKGAETAKAPPAVAQAAAQEPAGDGGSAAKKKPEQAGPGEALKGLKGLSPSILQGLTAAQVAQAARAEAAGGEGGAGFERDGGFVDSGPLTFDTAGYDWGSYAAAMIRKIKQNWDVPKLAYYGIKGWCRIRFYIMKDGHVEGVTLLVSSGIPPYDNAAMQAIRNASPFRPLPADLGHDREGVTVTFLYNIRPEDLDRTAPGGSGR